MGSRGTSTLSLISALDRDGWLKQSSGRFTPGKKTRHSLYMRLGGPQDRSGAVWKISPIPGFDPRTFQAVASLLSKLTVQYYKCSY